MDYKLLKKFLKYNLKAPSTVSKAVEERRLSPVPNQLENVADEKTFFKAVMKEVMKVNKCYRDMERELIPLTANVKKEYDDCIRRRATSAIADTEEEDIMEKCQNLHMRLLMVENYAVLNYCGFSKKS